MAAKTSTAKKAAAKPKTVGKKASAKKTAAGGTAARKTASKATGTSKGVTPKAAAKATAKKAVAKKVATKKKATTKKAATGKKAAPGKAAAKKAATKKSTTKTTAKKATTGKKAAPGKTAAKKVTPGKATAKKSAGASPTGKKATTRKATVTPSATKKTKSVGGSVVKSSEVFSKKFLAAQHEALLEERARSERQSRALRDEAESLVEDFQSGDVQFDEESGEGDTLNVAREQDLMMSSQADSKIEEIDHALSKFDLDTYGICEVSGQPIPEVRLEAIPWARERVEYKVGGLTRR